ncbi:MAG TPA: chemotaxis protein CheA [Candidatus Bathyarchaeota archaeon]|nr:chemotaxis protein CheA [Candidatus Bathyarchaeota archaeon]
MQRMSFDTEQYKELFIEEAKEHLQIITQSLLDLEKNPDNIEILNKIFRSAHTLKGSSGMMGFNDISELTHVMEDIFDELRKGARVSSNLIDVLFECVDALEARLTKLENGEDEPINISSLIKRLKECMPKEKEGKTVKVKDNSIKMKATKELRNGENLFIIHVKLSEDCVFKAARAFMILDSLEKIGKVVRSNPSKDEVEAGNFESTDFEAIVATNYKMEKIKNTLRNISEIAKVEIKEFCDGSLEKEDNKFDTTPKGTREVEIGSVRTVKVRTEQLDKLMNLVGELVINKIQLLKIASDYRLEPLKHCLSSIDRLTRELQDVVMQIRMVPIAQIFDRFPRLVRDLSRREGKKVNFIMKGREIEVDRTVLEEISEPLIHLLRNAIDHGIEPPDVRIKRGKPPEGTVKLIAERRRDSIIITVEDDGAGIDPEKVRRSAVEKGLISQSEAEKLGREQLINLVFLPGLSTSSKVTEISGRGVGLDVVKNKIVSLGGNVRLETEVGKGTKVTLTLPLSLAIIEAMLVKVTDQTYAIPISFVSEVASVKKENVRKLGNIEATIIRGKVIPLIQLRELLNLPLSESRNLTTVIINREPINFGLVVDSVIGLQEIVTKPLHESLMKIEGIGGVTILGNGQVILILDPIGLLSQRKRKSWLKINGLL